MDGVSTLVAVAKAGLEACKAAQDYQDEAFRIGKRLTWIVARTEKWQAHCGVPGNRTFDYFLEALERVYICMQAAGGGKNWRQRFANLMLGKNLLEDIQKAEAVLNSVINDFQIQQSNELIMRVDEGFKNIADRLDSFGRTPSNENPNQTIEQEMNQVLKMCHEKSSEVVFAEVSRKHLLGPVAENMKDEVVPGQDDIEHGVEKDDLAKKKQKAVFHPDEEALKSITILPGQIKFDEKDFLGGGGFAEVFSGTYYGENSETTRMVAVKRLKVEPRDLRGLSKQELARDAEQLAAEAYLTYKCSIHPNVVEIIGCQTSITDVHRPLIVMELLRTTLFDAMHYYQDLGLKEPLQLSRRLHLMKGIAGALEFLHLQGIIHHDVKSLNILLDQDFTVAKLADFGEAKVKGLHTTKLRLSTILATSAAKGKGALAGTVAYLAPEILAEEVSESSRVSEMYAFGATVWECMTDKIPHQGKKENSITVLAATKKTTPMLRIPSSLPTSSLSSSKLSLAEMKAWEAMKAVASPCLSRERTKRLTASEVLGIWNQRQPNYTLEMLKVGIGGVPPASIAPTTSPRPSKGKSSTPRPLGAVASPVPTTLSTSPTSICNSNSNTQGDHAPTTPDLFAAHSPNTTPNRKTHNELRRNTKKRYYGILCGASILLVIAIIVAVAIAATTAGKRGGSVDAQEVMEPQVTNPVGPVGFQPTYVPTLRPTPRPTQAPSPAPTQVESFCVHTLGAGREYGIDLQGTSGTESYEGCITTTFTELRGYWSYVPVNAGYPYSLFINGNPVKDQNGADFRGSHQGVFGPWNNVNGAKVGIDCHAGLNFCRGKLYISMVDCACPDGFVKKSDCDVTSGISVKCARGGSSS